MHLTAVIACWHWKLPQCKLPTLNTVYESWRRNEAASALLTCCFCYNCIHIVKNPDMEKEVFSLRCKNQPGWSFELGTLQSIKREKRDTVFLWGREGSESRGGQVWVQAKRKGDFHGTAEGWHKQDLAYEGHRRIMLTASTYNSYCSTFCLSPCLLVRLEPVLGQLAARYHYLLDSGQSNLSACSCFIELDKYNMWLTAIIYYRTALFIQQAEALVHLNWPLSLWWNYTQVMEAFERPFMGFKPVEKLTTWISIFHVDKL